MRMRRGASADAPFAVFFRLTFLVATFAVGDFADLLAGFLTDFAIVFALGAGVDGGVDDLVDDLADFRADFLAGLATTGFIWFI